MEYACRVFTLFNIVYSNLYASTMYLKRAYLMLVVKRVQKNVPKVNFFYCFVSQVRFKEIMHEKIKGYIVMM